ncbi:DEAD/DEAH box helicase, partial [Candidatus Poribacteria bacterium]|nr:DEAD/DEAH box helicase [Candidatus Poribacteria bacterium]
TPDAAKPVRFANFSVEMETGTGKTYVYLRTALELFRRYGFRKYIVVVPSVAVREGVLKTFEVTKAHFAEVADNTPYRFYAYDSANLTQVRQFALSNGVEFMVMTIDSFNKATNVIRQSTDRLQGETPIHLVQAARPILILDEPQNMESELRVRALANLDPLFALRYSATHRNPYNVVYRLTPFEAYRQGLVKRIEVAGIEQMDDANLPFLRLDEVRTAKRTLTARIAVHKLMKDGTVKEQVITVKPGENLQAQTNRPEYAAFVVDEINYSFEFVSFTSGIELQKGATLGADKEAIFEAQIRYTVEEHFRKQERLKPFGVKALSLFFIDRVDNYAQEDGIIRRLFDRCFDEHKANHPDWRDVDAASVQAAYFAQRRTKTGDIVLEDSKTGEAERDRETYDLIMRDKERLLSFEEPTAFIFSHSALREGWDNPNIFQICTLNQTTSEMKKRQEIGRGVRLAVNQSGERIRDEKVNILTVAANESYERYVERLQSEIVEEYGDGETPPRPANARQRGVARLRKEFTLKPEFRELWERIKHKTRYAVTTDTDQLIRDVVERLDNAEIRSPRIVVTRARVDARKDEDVFTAMQTSGAKTVADLAGKYPLPDLIGVMGHLLEHTSPPVRLAPRTLIEVLRRTKRRTDATDNPHEFAAVTVRLIKLVLDGQLVSGIRYEKTGEWYEMTCLQDEIETWEDHLTPAVRSVYDGVLCDSDVETQFVADLEARDDVLLYIKLPSWFTVPTPVGTYNPDWAIVLEERDEHGEATDKRLYLVRETKDTTVLDDLSPDEARKIRCGERHFVDALDVDYKVVTNGKDLRPRR